MFQLMLRVKFTLFAMSLIAMISFSLSQHTFDSILYCPALSLATIVLIV